MTYLDKYTRFHDRLVRGEGDIPSNNGWIYSAYGRHLLPNQGNFELRLQCFNECERGYFPLRIDRSPNDPTPPMSKDEIIGLVSFGFLTDTDLKRNHWNFCNIDTHFPKKMTFKRFFKSAYALYKMNKEVKKLGLEGSRLRNYVWEKPVPEAFDLAFYLAPWDQYYVLKYREKKPTLFQTIMFYLNFLAVKFKGNKSTRMMLWLQLEDMKHPLLKYIDRDKYVRDYFDEEHPFVKGLE